MKVVLATGAPRLNTQIEERFIDEIDVVGAPLYREAVESSIKRSDAAVVVLSDELKGVIEMSELILLIRARYGSTRIIFIGSETMSLDFKSFLYKYNVYDVINEKFSEEELRTAFFHPKTWEDVSKDIKTLDAFINEYDKPDINVKDASKITKKEYAKIKPSTIQTDSLYQEVISFWSASDESGKTFSSINTSLFLAANPDLKVLLLDFNILNPALHLQFGFQDADKNLGALIEDIEDGLVLNNKSISQYFITHPVYNNLTILPGILRQEEKDPDFYIQLLNNILEIAQSMNYSTILIDTDTGFRHPISIYILKKATKVIMHVNESIGALNAISKLFDPEFGDLVPLLINKKKIYPVVNRATQEYSEEFVYNLEAIIDGNKTCCIINEDPIIHESTMEGIPLLSKPTDESYMLFYEIGNLIHPNVFKPIKTNKKPDSGTTKKKSLFGTRNK